MEKFRGLKRISDIRTHFKKHHITAVANQEGVLQEDPKSIADAFAAFYEQLYSSRVPGSSTNLEGVNKIEIPTVTTDEIRNELKLMRKKKAADQAGLVVEMLQYGSDNLFRTISLLFTALLKGDGDPPDTWKESLITVLFKKGDESLAENYRPITLLRILYKLFAGIINRRIKEFLDASQCPDQAGFRKGFSCDDNIFTIVQVIEKLSEYQMPLWICAIDFKKAFDTVEHFSIWESLKAHAVPDNYIAVITALYTDQVGKVISPTESRNFKLERGTKQGDPMSPAIFNAVLELVFLKVQPKWRQKGWGIKLGSEDTDLLCNLRFADDILLLATSRRQLKEMTKDVVAATRDVGLELHPGKTKILRMDDGYSRSSPPMLIDGLKIEVLSREGSTMYLGRLLSAHNTQDTELDFRIERAWKKFFAHKSELCGKGYRLRDRLKLFDSVVTSTVLYGSGTWTMTQAREAKLRVHQRKMLRWMIGCGRKQGNGHAEVGEKDEEEEEPEPREEEDEIAAEGPVGLESWIDYIRRVTGIAEECLKHAKLEDWIAGQRRRKWRWAGHTARRHDGRWSNKILFHNEFPGSRRVGHPKARWRDAIESFVGNHTYIDGSDWTLLAQDRDSWHALENKFVHNCLISDA